jgi:hypothetical protein
MIVMIMVMMIAIKKGMAYAADIQNNIAFLRYAVHQFAKACL